MHGDAGKVGEPMVPIATPCRAVAVVHEEIPDRQLFSDEEPTPYYEPEDMPDVVDTNTHGPQEPPAVVEKTPETPLAVVESVASVPSVPAQPQPKKGPRPLTRQELPSDTCMQHAC
eukprot:s3_g26.t1